MSTRRKRPSTRPKTTAAEGRASARPLKVPFDTRVDTSAIGQVGRRPSTPVVPLITGLMWIVVGVVICVAFTAGWKYVVGGVCIGVGGLFIPRCTRGRRPPTPVNAGRHPVSTGSCNRLRR